MLLLLDIMLFILGLSMIIVGSELIVKSGNDIASRLMLTGVAVGAIFFALITAMPETFTTIYATYHGSAKIGFANLVGSNIHNVALAVGVSAFLTSLTYERFANRISLIMTVSILFASLLLLDGQMTRIKGVILILCYGLYIFYIIKKGRNNNHNEITKTSKSSKIIVLTFIAGGSILLLGSYSVVNSSLNLAQVLGVSSFYVSLMIMAFGSVIPEVAVSIASALKGNGSISISNVFGDNIFTIFVVLGLTGLLNPFSVSPKELVLSMVPMFTLTFLLFLITSKKDRKITKMDGLILLVVYLIILIVQTIYLI